MTIALRKSLQQLSRPEVSFGPFGFIEALPWLIVAAALRVVAFGGGRAAILALIGATIAVLQAFIAVARRSIELADGQTNLGSLSLTEEIRLSIGILGRIGLLMIIATVLLLCSGGGQFSFSMMMGLDGMAFDLITTSGKFWSAFIAALVLLMIIGAERDVGGVRFFSALDQFVKRWIWLVAAVAILGSAYIGLGFGQELVRSAIWNFWQTSAASQFMKNLIYFVFIFSFAMFRLWLTLQILTWFLKQSYIRGD
jgi:hypothetical protein